MSIVEKAMDKLNRSQPAKAPVAPPPAPPPSGAKSSGVTARHLPPAAASDLKIDLERFRKAGMLVPEEFDTRLTDEYRRIKRPLLANAFGKGAAKVEQGNMIVISSSVAGEGKTFTSVNLALSIAQERDRTVLLVDADVAKPHITRLLGLQNAPGLIDVLLDEQLDLADVLLRTDIPSFVFLPAGKRHPQATELLASLRMEKLAREIAQRYADRVVLFDSPPLLATSEAQVLAGLMGQIVMVVKAGATPQHAVQQALETLDRAKAINLVLNQSRHTFGNDYYYGGYHGYSQ